MVPIVQLVRASDCGSECRRFESDWAPFLVLEDFLRGFFVVVLLVVWGCGLAFLSGLLSLDFYLTSRSVNLPVIPGLTFPVIPGSTGNLSRGGSLSDGAEGWQSGQ